jgi:hypothetical protein
MAALKIHENKAITDIKECLRNFDIDDLASLYSYLFPARDGVQVESLEGKLSDVYTNGECDE